MPYQLGIKLDGTGVPQWPVEIEVVEWPVIIRANGSNSPEVNPKDAPESEENEHSSEQIYSLELLVREADFYISDQTEPPYSESESGFYRRLAWTGLRPGATGLLVKVPLRCRGATPASPVLFDATDQDNVPYSGQLFLSC